MPGKISSLVERFKNLNLRIFEKHGIKVVGAWLPVDGPSDQFV